MTDFAKAWPLVAVNDDGIRPAGKPDECLYCKQKIGTPHGFDCVMVEKKVRMRWTFEVEIDVPHHWNESDVLFHYGESSWCANNAIVILENLSESSGCLCRRFSAEYAGVVDDTRREEICGKRSNEHTRPVPAS